MKRLIPFFLLVLFGAGCLSSRTNQAPLTTIKVQDTKPNADSTTQAEIPLGTEHWQSYKNYSYGFGFRYPSEAVNKYRVDAATGTVFALDLGPTVASSTALSVPYAILEAKVVPRDGHGLPTGASLKDGCYDEAEGKARILPKANYAGKDFCVTSIADAAAGNRYDQFWYSVLMGEKYLVIAYTYHSVSCANYDKPGACLAFDEGRDTSVGNTILSTLGLFEPSAQADESNMRLESRTTKKTDKMYEVDLTYPEMMGGDEKVRTAFNDAIREYVSTTTDSFLAYAKDSQGDQGSAPYSLQGGYSSPFVSDKLINVVFEGYEFTGGAHGNYIYRTFVFDTATGKELKLQDFFVDKKGYLAAIAKYASQEITKRDVSDADWIKTGTAPDKANYQFFYWTKDGLTIVFPPYQVAAYAAGPQDVIIPFSELVPRLEPDAKVLLGL